MIIIYGAYAALEVKLKPGTGLDDLQWPAPRIPHQEEVSVENIFVTDK